MFPCDTCADAVETHKVGEQTPKTTGRTTTGTVKQTRDGTEKVSEKVSSARNGRDVERDRVEEDLIE
jgi:hypothetical protein